MLLRAHDIVLHGNLVTLRPLTEEDWDVLLRWNSDPDVLYFADGEDVSSYDLPTVQSIYRTVSQNAFCFIIELGGLPIGEGWLQQINVERLIKEKRRNRVLQELESRWGRKPICSSVHLVSQDSRDFGAYREDRATCLLVNPKI